MASSTEDLIRDKVYFHATALGITVLLDCDGSLLLCSPYTLWTEQAAITAAPALEPHCFSACPISPLPCDKGFRTTHKLSPRAAARSHCSSTRQRASAPLQKHSAATCPFSPSSHGAAKLETRHISAVPPLPPNTCKAQGPTQSCDCPLLTSPGAATLPHQSMLLSAGTGTHRATQGSVPGSRCCLRPAAGWQAGCSPGRSSRSWCS